jgi:HSP20 family protein
MNIVLRKNGIDEALVPFYRPLSMFDVWEELEKEMWDSWRPFPFDNGPVPHIDMYEEKDQLVMKTELPGIENKDLDVTLEGDKLTIKAERKEEVTEDTKHRTGARYYEEYLSTVTLPYPVKKEQISATLENGTLELRLPKADEVKPKKIEIKAQLPQDESKKQGRKPRQKKS